MKVGNLVRDLDNGDIGLVMSEVRSYEDYIRCGSYVMVLWPSNDGTPVEMDMTAIDKGYAEVISEGR